MAAIRPVVMVADENARTFAESVAPGHVEFDGPTLHATKEMHQLATPWSVAIARAGLLKEIELPQGILLDPACGSATQLAALCTALNRPGLGIELSGAVAPLASVNLAKASEWSDGEWGQSSRILWGDGTDSAIILSAYRENVGESNSIALLHVDPARPPNAQRHTLDELEPRLDDLLHAWAPHLPRNPALILDLSPRLSDLQRTEVNAIVADIWPHVPTTWQWMTQGRGRIDRLSLWIGLVAATETHRLLRLSSDGRFTMISGHPSETIVSNTLSAKIGLYLSLVDPSLISSGLAKTWQDIATSGGDSDWIEIEGRRPSLVSEYSLIEDSVVQEFIQISGRIEESTNEANFDNVENLANLAMSVGLTSLKIRCRISPEIQPKMQSSLDRSLKKMREGDDTSPGFLAQVENTYYLCRQSE